jgi:hypothetical protein
MARICINITREGRPTIVREEILLAAQHAGVREEIGTIGQGDSSSTVHRCDPHSVPSKRVEYACVKSDTESTDMRLITEQRSARKSPIESLARRRRENKETSN